MTSLVFHEDIDLHYQNTPVYDNDNFPALGANVANATLMPPPSPPTICITNTDIDDGYCQEFPMYTFTINGNTYGIKLDTSTHCCEKVKWNMSVNGVKHKKYTLVCPSNHYNVSLDILMENIKEKPFEEGTEHNILRLQLSCTDKTDADGYSPTVIIMFSNKHNGFYSHRVVLKKNGEEIYKTCI